MARRRKDGKKATAYFDYNLLFILIFLLCFGLVMLYSSSSYTSANLYDDSAHYLKLQFRNILVGVIPMYFFARVDYHFWKKFGFFAYFCSFALCVLVMFPIPGLTRSSHGQSRWLNLGPFSFQPSELAKLAVIIFLAMLIERIPKKLGNFSSIIKVMVIMFPLFAVIAYSNLSTAVIVFGIAVCMLFVASPKYKQFVIVGVGGVSFVVAFIMLASYRSGRVQAWLHPETAGDDGYQTLQGLYAIGSGKLFGKGVGESLQKMGHVPESLNDMIFTIICEELGVFGAIIVWVLFGMLLYRLLFIAQNAPDMYGSLVVTGIFAHIALQVILNVMVVINLIPTTGITLPFISYGGTSVLFLMAEMGIALGVSRKIKFAE